MHMYTGTKVIVKLAGILSFISLAIYFIPIIETFITNVYDMELICLLMVIASIISSAHYLLLKYIIDKNNYMENLPYLLELQHIVIINNNLSIMINLIMQILMIITYTIWWIIADLYNLSAALYYLALVICCIAMLNSLSSYIKSMKKLKDKIDTKL